MELQSITIPPQTGKPPKGLMILLHGWGANSQDLSPFASVLDLPEYQFVFPEAPFPHPQVPWGRAWYALETSQYTGLTESRQLLQTWLESLEAQTGIPPSRMVLGGFSQGGAMTLDVGRTMPFAGLIVLSGYLHFSPDGNQGFLPPILLVHGRQDTVVPLAAATKTKTQFEAIGAKIQYHEFDMGHEIRPEVLGLIRSFVVEVMSKST